MPFEPFGLVVPEAMACGLPVVGVASGGVAESVDVSLGQQASRSIPGPFADAVAALFERDVAEIGRRARARAVKRHGWDPAFEQLTDAYAALSGARAFAAPSRPYLTH